MICKQTEYFHSGPFNENFSGGMSSYLKACSPALLPNGKGVPLQ